jgi:hypothetical protein
MSKPLVHTGTAQEWSDYAHRCEDRLEKLQEENAELQTRLNKVWAAIIDNRAGELTGLKEALDAIKEGEA